MKRRLLLLLMAALLPIACGKTDPSPAPEPTASAEIEATEEPTAPVETEAPGEPEPAAEDPIPVEPWLYAPEESRYVLAETNDVRLSISFTRSFRDDVDIVLWEENRTALSITARITDITLNGTIRMADDEYLWMSANCDGGSSVKTSFKEVCELIGYENIHELSANVRFEDYPGHTAAIPVTISFPEGITPRFSYEAYLDMRADRQVIRQDDDVTIALLGCGRFVNHEDYNSLKGILWIENHGSKTIPVVVSNVSVAGITVESHAGQRTLKPNESCLIDFYIRQEAIEAAGIRSIDALDLQIMTSEEENTGGHFLTGGSWYPVVLAQSGVSVEPDETGTVVYEDDLLTLRLVHTELKECQYSSGSIAEVRYTLLVENRRMEGISLKINEPTVNGKPYLNAYHDSDWNYVDISNNNLGPQSKGYMVALLRLKPEEVSDGTPTFSFLLNVLSQGKDTIFYTTAEPIVLADQN